MVTEIKRAVLFGSRQTMRRKAAHIRRQFLSNDIAKIDACFTIKPAETVEDFLRLNQKTDCEKMAIFVLRFLDATCLETGIYQFIDEIERTIAFMEQGMSCRG